jgi:deltex
MSFPVAAIAWDDDTDAENGVASLAPTTPTVPQPLTDLHVFASSNCRIPFGDPSYLPGTSFVATQTPFAMSLSATLPIVIRYDAPRSLNTAVASTNAAASTSTKTSHDTAFVVTKSHKDDDSKEEEVEKCTICWEALNVDDAAAAVVQIRSCSHLFHAECFNASIQHDTKCPICRAPICAEPIGHGPSGTMQISLLKNQPCPGFDDCESTWQLDYSLPSGSCQYPYHENPGHSYSGTHRTAFIPNTPPGRELLARLQYAWMHGLLFRVGTSITSGATNTVVWSSIHHKTSLDGGAHGFPDDSYIQNCHEALDQVHVPPAGQCGVYDNVTEKRTARKTWTYAAPPTLAGSVALQQAIQEPYSKTTATTTANMAMTTKSAARNKTKNASATAVVPLAPSVVGKCPSGTMTINVLPDVICPGFDDDTTTIEIVYTIPNGIQHTYHSNPGVPYAGTARTTYLPNTDAGRDLLWRLRYAWRHGLVFDVGTSLTTGATNVTVWSTAIAHKTRLNHSSANTAAGRSTRRSTRTRAAAATDPFAFPDDAFIDHCHRQLDALHVPDARTLSMGAQF